MIGSLLILASAFVFSVMTMLVQAAGKRGIPSFQMMVIRCIIQASYGGYMCLWLKLNPFGTKGKRLVPFVRGILGPAAAAFLYYGATHIAVADATVLMFSSPIWTPFMARCISGEKLSFIKFATIAVGFMGVIFVTQPAFLFDYLLPSDDSSPDDENSDIYQPGTLLYTISAMVCIAGALCNGFSYVIMRKAGKGIHYQVYVFYYGFIGIFSTTILLFIFQGFPVNPPDVTTWIYLIMISVCGCIGQTTLSKGAQLIEASTTAVIRNADIAFVLLWQILFLDLFPTLWSFIGLLLITSCTIIMPFTKDRSNDTPSQEIQEIELDELDD